MLSNGKDLKLVNKPWESLTPTKWYSFEERFPKIEKFKVKLQDGTEFDAQYLHGYLYIFEFPFWRRPNHQRNERITCWLGFEDVDVRSS